LSRKGENNGRALLLECEVREIRALWNGGARNGGKSAETLAREYNVSIGAINGILYKGNWKDVK
jgi:hypothetical protein